MNNDLPTQNPTELLPITEQQLDDALAAKADVLKFTAPSPSDPISTINLSKFGLKNAQDVKAFLLSPAGETVKHEIGTHLAEEAAIREQLQFEQLEEQIRRQHLKTLLFRWLFEKKAHAAEKLRIFIDEQNEHLLQQSKANAHETGTLSPAPVRNNQQQIVLVTSFDKDIRACQDEQRQLRAQEKSLSALLVSLMQGKKDLETKHEAYERSLKSFERSSEKHEKSSDAALSKKMEQLQKKIAQQTDKITKVLDKGDEKTARKLLLQQNALNLQLASLYDIQSVRKKGTKGKGFYGASGEAVTSQKDATYVVNNTEKLVIRGNKKFLIPAGKTLEELSIAEKSKAEERFKRAEPELLLVKKSVQRAMKMEQEAHNGRISETIQKQEVNRSEQRQLENHMNLVQSARATAQKAAEDPSGQAPSPRPSMSLPTGKGMSGTVTGPNNAIQNFYIQQEPFLRLRNLTPRFIFELLKKHVADPKEKATIMKHLRDTLQLDKIPSLSPLPYTTITLLLQTMERYGVVANKPNVTSIQSPLTMQQHPQRKEIPPPVQVQPKQPQTAPKQKVTEEPEPERKFHPTPFGRHPLEGG